MLIDNVKRGFSKSAPFDNVKKFDLLSSQLYVKIDKLRIVSRFFVITCEVEIFPKGKLLLDGDTPKRHPHLLYYNVREDNFGLGGGV